MLREKKWLKWSILLGSLLTLSILLFVFSIWTYAKIAGAPDLAVGQTTIYYADDQTVIGEASNGHKRYWATLDEVSPAFTDAIVAIEDRSFYEHGGLDFKRLGGAILADIKARKKVQGASTISQQYAKNLYLSQEKTWSRKLTEALYALRIEANYSKDEILEGYINTIYFGHGMYGIEAASQYFFHKPAKDLDIAEATLLAGIPKGPSIYSPLFSEKNAKDRQSIILDSLVETKKITKQDKALALAEPLHFYGSDESLHETIAPYFQDEAKKEVIQILSDRPDLLKQGGLRIHTTLNVNAQKNAEQVVESTIPTQSEIQLAVITMDPRNGDVKAMIGGRNYDQSPFNRATQSLRQPGSTIKPILYYTALENGFTPSTTIRSEATSFSYDDGRSVYTPHNFNNQYANKEITMVQALAVSDNIYAVKTNIFLGEDKLASMGAKFGIKSKFDQLPSSALGTSVLRPIEITNAFNYLANDGKKVQPTYVTSITDYKGNIIYTRKEKDKQILDEGKAFVVAQMMKGIFDARLNGYTSVTGASVMNKVTHEYSAKSGSTNTDNWMIGFTPDLTTGVWVGYDTDKNLELWTEQKFAKNIWVGIMESDLAAVPVSEMTVPKDVVAINIDPETGLRANKDCPVSRLTYFTKGTEPTDYCYLHGASKDAKHQTHKKVKKEEKKKPWYKNFF